jgi:hypothetical protein
MKILTEPQIDRICGLLLKIEKSGSKEETVSHAEAIRAVILQGEQVTLKFEQ